MLVMGMALNYANPIEDKAGQDAFAFWLESHLKTQNDVVLDEIEALSNDSEKLESVIRKASELVYSHSDDFELPTSESNDQTSEEDLYQLLLTEWNNYQSSASGMGKAVFVKTIKPQTILPSDGHFFSSVLTKRSLHFDIDQITNLGSTELVSGNSYNLSPLKSGTAIGAP
tara:strand:+ start:28882 stop:29394 length:513 start_codon:yes stop_codon:yes gene_type:complete